ncbi:MAG TPA: GNAT family N-acetyltransferase [Deltaproteobacteria bacterium]|nr:GNAT family N-acetyltransferase [Deltaproteobacteria bacterium]HOA44432.1 GNAT family N-acetyltransferase [Deltaproteobacteria bacterium]HOY75175.1 GNAT family N-acetyltransferase [Deltaproteobacteria bacterium]HPH50717.1 GNAT family N-acetyltransferase [Deltaproteobacteria bacterium]HQO60235.1 GNAT family N-acetyltransferase [Deltaproteobacteria bacterium]
METIILFLDSIRQFWNNHVGEQEDQMPFADADRRIAELKELYPGKFLKHEEIFRNIRRGDRIFVGTGCSEPRHLVKAFMEHARAHPKAFFDAELSHLLALGLTPHSFEAFRPNFRQNFFYVADSTRDAVNSGQADYTPIALSQVPRLIRRRLIPIDVAFIQVSPPGENGFLSLGISVDIMKEAIRNCPLVIAQVNARMPFSHGESLIDPEEVDFFIHHDEGLLEYVIPGGGDAVSRIGTLVARIIPDGSTIQVGYGRVPNAVLSALHGKKHLGVHTELLGSGIVDLMRRGVVDNTKKSSDTGRTVASLCLGTSDIYDYVHDNPAFSFMPVDYTNNPAVIAGQTNMVAINTALQIDLTGQATSESIGEEFYSGIGGNTDFMRAVAASPAGRTILVLPSTAQGNGVSRIVPFLSTGAGVTYNRADVHYVVTEYGICYLHGKNIRERAMSLIAIAHPKFRPWLIDEAKRHRLIFPDQAFFPGEQGEYPADLETHRTTRTGLTVFLRPIKISDEALHKEFVYSLSDQSLYMRFLVPRAEVPRRDRQRLVVIDYTRHMAILAIIEHEDREEIVGVARYAVEDDIHRAVLAIVVRDDYQNQGVGSELLDYVTLLARKQGLLGFTGEVFADNRPVLRMLKRFRDRGFDVQRTIGDGVLSLRITFSDAE